MEFGLPSDTRQYQRHFQRLKVMPYEDDEKMHVKKKS